MEKIQKHTDHKQLTAETWVNKLLTFAQRNEAAVAIYRLPNESKLRVICDLGGGQKISDLNLEDLSSGFLIHPFNLESNDIVHFGAEIVAEIEIGKSDTTQENNTKVSWLKSPRNEVEDQIIQTDSTFDFKKLKGPSDSQSTSKEDYIDMVNAGIRQIKEEKFYKVVPSKIKKIDFKGEISLGLAFINACGKYPNAFVNLTYSDKTGLWLGASPETLIEDRKGEYFKTMALAGTQAKADLDIAATSWTQKEIEEQAYVSRYIINCFKKIRLRDFDEIGPKTVAAGNLLHLKTTFKVDTKQVNFPELGSVMLELLHPTSAVCGMPKKEALDFLRNEEKHDREYFSGYLGPVHMQGSSHLFVNLRCCQIGNGSLTFYAGAGITEDSQAEKEWQETEMKCQVLSEIVF